MVNEPWFSLALLPQHIVRLYNTYVRRIMVYGSEPLSHDDR